MIIKYFNTYNSYSIMSGITKTWYWRFLFLPMLHHHLQTCFPSDMFTHSCGISVIQVPVYSSALWYNVVKWLYSHYITQCLFNVVFSWTKCSTLPGSGVEPQYTCIQFFTVVLWMVLSIDNALWVRYFNHSTSWAMWVIRQVSVEKKDGPRGRRKARIVTITATQLLMI